jgi:ribosomal protein S18 acetylase RimI-like enzyme
MIDRETIRFRAETEDDVEFMLRLYASTREEELRQVDWTDEQKAEFVRQQFDAQRTHYRGNYDDAEYLVIVENDVPIGRLYLHRRPEDLRIMDIALMPEHRRRGIGALLLQEVLDEAGASGKTASIHVEVFNPALRLYERLGFRRIDTFGPYYLLEWSKTG